MPDEVTRARTSRLGFLAEASKAFAASLDFHTTLTSVARLAVPHIADWCVVDVVEADGSLRRLAVVHVDPAKVELAEELQRRYPSDPDNPAGVNAVIAGGQSVLIPEIPESAVLAAARDAEHVRLLQALGIRSYMIVPLKGRTRTLGVITMVAAESERRFGPEDLTLAEELAARGAQAIDNAVLFRQAQRLAAIFTVAPDPILILDQAGGIADLNPAAETDFGWQRAELLGRSLLTLLAPEAAGPAADWLAALWQGAGVAPLPIRARGRGGEMRHVLAAAALQNDETDRPTAAVVLLKDVTAMRLAQERLEASLAQFELIIQVGPLILAARSRRELFTAVAEYLAGRFGYDAVSLLSVNQAAGCLELQARAGYGNELVPADFRIPLGRGISGQVALHGRAELVPDVSGDPRHLTAAPGLRFGSEVDVPVIVQGRVVAVICAMSRTAGALREEHRSALETIAHRAALGLEMLALYEELQAKNEEMEAFLYAASHDLRSPLINVLGFSQELQLAGVELRRWAERAAASPEARAEVEALFAEDIQPALRFIGAAVKKMEVLVDGLLLLSRIGRQPLVLQTVAVADLIQEVLDGMQAELAGAEVVVGHQPPVAAEPGRLSQVFANLIGNAVRYADPTRPCRIEIRGESRGEWCRYCVADNGIGIAREHTEQIFKPFHRLDPGDGKGGHGLGLSIVDRIVRRHGGRLSVESTPGAGSRFWLELPREKEM